jgi:hypothetical protein
MLLSAVLLITTRYDALPEKAYNVDLVADDCAAAQPLVPFTVASNDGLLTRFVLKALMFLTSTVWPTIASCAVAVVKVTTPLVSTREFTS